MKLKGLFALAVSIIIVLGIVCVPVSAASNDNVIVYSAVNDFKVPNEYLYGRKQLESMENSSYLLALYDALYNGVENCSKTITIDDPDGIFVKNHVTDNNKFSYIWNTAWEAYSNDHPEQFWWAYTPAGENQVYKVTNVKFSTFEGASTSMSFELAYDNDLYNNKEKFENEVRKLLYGLTSNTDEYTREKIIHDRLISKVTYVKADHDYNAYGAIIDGKAVCEGYSRALQYLLMRAGIFSHTVTGLAYDYEAKVYVNHAWNLVKIHGDYYYVDATWDDKETLTSYAYFNVDDYQTIEYDHVPYNIIHGTYEYTYTIPPCVSMQYNYYVYDRGIIIDTFDTKQIADALSENGTARIISFDTDLFINFLDLYDEDLQGDKEIVKSLGITGGYDYGGLQTYGEIIPYLYKENTMTVYGTVAGVDNSEKTTVELIKDGEVKYSQQLNKAVCDYNFNNIVMSDYTLKVSKNGHTVYTEQIIGDYSVAQIKDVTLYLYGDVNSDGSFNISDLVRLKKAMANNTEMNEKAFNITSSSQYADKLVEMRKMLFAL